LQGALTEQLLQDAEQASEASNNRFIMRDLCGLRGEFALQRRNPSEAIASFEKYMEMSQVAGISAVDIEPRLALALASNRSIVQAHRTLDRVRDRASHVDLAELYLKLGEPDKARHHALAGYPRAWADGPKYSNWWDLKRCGAVLSALGVPEPKHSAYDPNTAKPIPYEAEVRTLIAKLKRDQT
jgi:hypothetical protein